MHPTATEREVHELKILPPVQWRPHCARGRGVEDPHRSVRLERAESTLPVIAFDSCFIENSVSELRTVANAGATCLVLVDVDTLKR